ncbi:COX15/CtaA family protein [Agromyces sp. SYSU T00194]|uniref:COX15/CtaA family protein n=1 Tax=Agromyces chitinivorans TaxID=3158560 RepID=UPI003399AC43
MNRFVAWLPDHVDRRIRVFGWLSLASQIVIVGTGGLVRLTGSGLGCPTWPRCTDESFVATPEMGVHGVIEFGNRLLTFVLIAIALITFVLLWRLRRQRRDLFWIAFALGAGIPLQGVVGGITVLTQLNPYVVGLHFVVSAGLVALATVLVHRMHLVPGPRTRVVPGWYAGLAHATSAVLLVTLLAGIVTTGSGPHAGDGGAARTGLDPEFVQHVHAWPAYVLLALTLVLLIAGFARGLAPWRWALALLAVEAVQITVGLIQANTGLPPFLVGAHMVLACLAVATMTAFVLHLKAPAAVAAEASAPADAVTR